MKYSKMLKERFPEISLNLEDLYVLESFQIKYLPERLPKKEFALMLQTYPHIKDFLITKCPEITDYINTILKDCKEPADKDHLNELCNDLLWEIGELIIYNKYTEVFDYKCNFSWKIEELISRGSLKGKVVADVGAGSGKLTFLLSKYAKTVYAIEPLHNFRKFIKEKVKKEKITNIYVIDGFLNSVPFPDNFFDALMTSNAIGWDIDNELAEIERVLKSKAHIIHLMRNTKEGIDNPFHETLVSKSWSYKFREYTDKEKIKYKYYKTIN